MLINAQNGINTHGALSPINDLAGVLIQQYAGYLEETIEMAVQQELAEAKEQGLSAVQSFVYNNSNDKKDKYGLLAISAETASKLLQGEFKTIEELISYNSNSDGYSLHMLYREVENLNRKVDITIVESIFIDEK